MSLTTFIQRSQLDHILASLSKLGAGSLVFVTSLVSFRAQV